MNILAHLYIHITLINAFEFVSFGTRTHARMLMTAQICVHYALVIRACKLHTHTHTYMSDMSFFMQHIHACVRARARNIFYNGNGVWMVAIFDYACRFCVGRGSFERI